MKELKKVKKPFFSANRHAYLIELSENKREKNITYERKEAVLLNNGILIVPGKVHFYLST